MVTLKIRYCHNMFDKLAIREFTNAMLVQAMLFYGIRWQTVGFDSNHAHITLDMGIRSRPEIAKLLKGFTAPRIFKEFPWLKKWLFRSHGFWSPVMDGRDGDMKFYNKYVEGQKYGARNALQNQSKLTAFV
ncbi:transposase [Candidatus Woesearchaeota archaeon]|nr:transposase [Candidatus Woesearchaeota archaeon]